jgi:hypothetical protein
MLKTIKFCWYCIRHAWRGCWTRANELGAVLGGVLLALAIWLCSSYLRQRELIEAPTSYWGVAALSAGMAICSVILAFLLIFFTRLLLAPVRLYWDQRERADKTDAELKIARKRRDADATKWTIKELFQHIDPEFLDHKSWEKIGDELRDALSMGRLTMWGRLKETESGPWVGPRAALTPIERTYWELR